MPPIPHVKNISGYCPYLDKEITIEVEYNELTFLGNVKDNHFTRACLKTHLAIQNVQICHSFLNKTLT